MGIYDCIVELETGVFLAPWEGDPGRTLQIENAKIFESHEKAQRAIDEALKYRKFSYPVVVPCDPLWYKHEP